MMRVPSPPRRSFAPRGRCLDQILRRGNGGLWKGIPGALLRQHDVGDQGGLVERNLLSAGRLDHLGAHALHHGADLEAGRGDVLEQGGGLVGQLTQAMTNSMGALGDDDKRGDAATQQLKQTLPETLADALMGSGGIGLAAQLDQMWHPNATSSSVSKNQADAAAQQGATATGGSKA